MKYKIIINSYAIVEAQTPEEAMKMFERRASYIKDVIIPVSKEMGNIGNLIEHDAIINATTGNPTPIL